MTCTCSSTTTNSQHPFPPGPENPFNPEFCIPTPVGKVCIPILTGPTFPGPSPLPDRSASLESWRIVRNDCGIVTRAATLDGQRLEYKTATSTTKKKLKKSMVLSQAGDRVMTITAEVAKTKSKPRPLMERSQTVIFETDAATYRTKATMDNAARIRFVSWLDDKKQEDQMIDVFDPVWQRKLKQKRSIFDKVLQKRLAPFEPVMRVVADAYWSKARRDIAGMANAFKVPDGDQPMADIWSSICRASCWALAGAVGGACCVGSAPSGPVGCVICLGGTGAAGSLCSDFC